MSRSNTGRWLPLLLLGVLPMIAIAAEQKTPADPAVDTPADPPADPAADPAKTAEPAKAADAKTDAKSVAWLSGLEEGQHEALRTGKPVLVRAGAQWCPSCRRQAEEIEKPLVQRALARWTPVYVDVDRLLNDARELGAGTIPTLRIRTSGGRQVAAHDRYLSADELVAWLDENYAAALATPDAVLLQTGKPNALATVRLIRQLGVRDPAVREAAIRRLMPHPDAAAAVVVKAFGEGNLAVRLAALELLGEWRAPVEDLDPWRPESITDGHLAALQKWTQQATAGQAAAGQAPPPQKLSADQLLSAGRQIDRLLAASDSEAQAIRGRLARLGDALLPEVYQRLKQASTDRDRERLLALRYQLVAGETLALRWPGGLRRLAVTDTGRRQRAAGELAKLATDDDRQLLLELFSDPDPLVREISLRGLRDIGGRQAIAALVKLLEDPEPNVRAAVLNQLAEDPPAAMVPKVAEYLKTEKDADLVVHGVRFLRAVGGTEAAKALMPLLDHQSWQVRAEAAEALGGALDSSDDNKLKADGCVALIELLKDSDAFVVSRAVKGLAEADTASAVEPLVAAAQRHPGLASEIVEILSGNSQMRTKALRHLRKFATHADPAIRAAALHGLSRAAPNAMEEELAAGLKDTESSVRIAAATVLCGLLESRRNSALSNLIEPDYHSEITFSGIEVEMSMEFEDPFAHPPQANLMTRALRALGLGRSEESQAEEDQQPPAVEKGPDPAPEPVPEPDPEPAPEPVPEPDPEPVPPDDPPQPDGKEKPSGHQKPAPPAEDPVDKWLTDFYAGKGRPAWMTPLVEPLEQMLQASSAEERLAAALALVPLGKADQAMPVLLEAARTKRKTFGRATMVLPWLVWEERLRVFGKLRSMVDDEGDFSLLVYFMIRVADRRAGDVFWEMLGDEKITASVADSLEGGLRRAYYGKNYNDRSEITASQRREMAAVAGPRAAEGPEWQRVVALALLLGAAPQQAAEVAGKMAHDPKLTEPLRRDAFQILLAASPKDERTATATAALSWEDPLHRRMALSYLAGGSSQINYLRGGISLWYDSDDRMDIYYSSGEPIIPEPPKGLKPQEIRPLLDDADPQTAAYAGYLLVLLDDRSGLEKLLEYWRRQETQQSFLEDRLTWLVYRAIAVMDDPVHQPILEKIYTELEEYEMAQFYWTIRIMSGPEILRFRKRIRDEVGMDSLR